jgi:hypothetical protein
LNGRIDSASEGDIFATTDIVVTVANTVATASAVIAADIAINATGNTADTTTTTAIFVTSLMAKNLNSCVFENKICPDINTERKDKILTLLIEPLLFSAVERF